MDIIVFRSRVDPLLAGLVIVPVVVTALLVVQRAAARGQRPGAVAFATLTGSIGLIAWIFATTAYRLTNHELLVFLGPLWVRVPLAQIQRITRTRSVLSAPALSLDRLEIAWGNGQTVVISPNDHAAFFATAAAPAPQAQLPAGI